MHSIRFKSSVIDDECTQFNMNDAGLPERLGARRWGEKKYEKLELLDIIQEIGNLRGLISVSTAL